MEVLYPPRPLCWREVCWTSSTDKQGLWVFRKCRKILSKIIKELGLTPNPSTLRIEMIYIKDTKYPRFKFGMTMKSKETEASGPYVAKNVLNLEGWVWQ